MYTSILYVLDHCFYLPLNHLFLSTIVPEQLYCNEKVIFCYTQKAVKLNVNFTASI